MVSKPEPAPPVWSLYSPAQRWTYLFILFLVSTSNYVDRNIIAVLLEPIKAEFKVSDTLLGLLSGFSFALLYATLGIPVARLADRGNRRKLISVAIVIWSGMTALCGVAQNFWQLALARFGVGAGEAGAIPPAQSLIADYFSPVQRGRALSFFMVSATAGYLIGLVGGSYIAATQGWRAAFIIVGLPGLLIAVLTLAVLREPRELPQYALAKNAQEPLLTTFRALTNKPSFVALLISMTFYFLFAYGGAVFVPSYIVRVLQIDLQTMGATYGAVGAAASVIGTLLGGLATDRLARRDPRWLVWLPAIGLVAALVANVLSYVVPTFNQFLGLSFVGGAVLAGTMPAMFAAIHMVCGSQRRAMAIAIVFFFANLIGLGLGPIIAGALSDYFSASMGPAGLRVALMLATLALLPCVGYLYRAGRTLSIDSEP